MEKNFFRLIFGFSLPIKLAELLLFENSEVESKVAGVESIRGTGLVSAPGGENLSMQKQNSLPPDQQKQTFPEQEGSPTRQGLVEAVGQVNRTMEIYRTELRFILDEKSEEIMVKVINAETGEVIREIPPEWVLKIVADVKKMLGLILDKFI